MNLSIQVERKDVMAVARFLDRNGRGCFVAQEDGARLEDVLVRMVCQAAVMHGIKSKGVVRFVEREYARFAKAKKRPAKHAK